MIHQVEETAANYDLRITSFVLEKQVSATSFYQVRLKVGSDANPCVTLAGVWKMMLMLKVAGDTFTASVEPREQEIYASNAAYKEFISAPIALNAADTIAVGLQSPNMGDGCVAVTAWLFDLNYALPDAAAAAEGGLPVCNADGRAEVDADTTAVGGQNLGEKAGSNFNILFNNENNDADVTLTGAASFAARVWQSGTRTLSSYGTLVADVVTAMQAAGTMLKALDDLTKAAGNGDLAAMKTIIDALPDAGALTTLQAAADAIQAVTDVIPDAGALTTLQAAVDALVAGAPINIDNNGIVITNEDITP